MGRLNPIFLVGLAASLASWVEPEAAMADTRYFVLPTEIETDRGAANGNATLWRFMPAYEFEGKDDWRLQNLDLILLADAPSGVPGRPGNPSPVPGGRATGLSDWIHATFVTTKNREGLIAGGGLMISIPTATDPALGSGKWAIGPAFRITWRGGAWNIGAFGGQRWSFAGKSSRADTSQLMIRGAIRRQLPNRWFLTSAPIITANWNADSSDRWLIPLGGGVGRSFRIADKDWAISVHGYQNVVRPEGAPRWSARIAFVAVIPIAG